MAIHRKWSLLTGPTAILGGIVAVMVVGNYFFAPKHPWGEYRDPKKTVIASTK